MKYTLLVLALLATNSFAKDKIKLDPNCEKAAAVAEGLAQIKQIGYTVDQLNAFVTESSVQVFPIQSLKLYVYGLNTSPLEIKNHILNFCSNVGFDKFNRYLLTTDEVINLKIENENLNNKIKFLLEENTQLKENSSKQVKKK